MLESPVDPLPTLLPSRFPVPIYPLLVGKARLVFPLPLPRFAVPWLPPPGLLLPVFPLPRPPLPVLPLPVLPLAAFELPPMPPRPGSIGKAGKPACPDVNCAAAADAPP